MGRISAEAAPRGLVSGFVRVTFSGAQRFAVGITDEYIARRLHKTIERSLFAFAEGVSPRAAAASSETGGPGMGFGADWP